MLPQQKIFSNCNVGLIERRAGAQRPTKTDRWPRIFAVYSRRLKATEGRGRAAALPLPPAANYRETSKKGTLPFSGPSGRPENMNGQEEENDSEDENQQWKSGWMSIKNAGEMSKAEDQRHTGVTCLGGALLKVLHLPGLVWSWASKQWEKHINLSSVNNT